MANADITAIVTGDTRLLDEALNRVVSKPRSLKFSVDNSSSGALGRIRSELGEFSRSLAASNARVLAFGASAGAMYAVGKSIKELVKSTVEVERRLTGINSILGASRSEFGRFGNELFRIAQETSSSFNDVADAAEELARQGVGIEETLKRTSSAMKLVRISGVSAVTAVEAMTAALNTNNDVLLTSESLINKLAAVDAKFAVSAAGLTEALKRVGSVAVDAGFSIDELIAAVTSAQQTTARGEAVISNSLKTIFTRAQRPKVLEDFQSLGIETKNAAGNIRPLKDILIEVAKQYDNLSSAQQSNISELVGGVYQINILKALFRDLGKETSIFGRAFEESFGATDQASQRVAQLNETLDALFKRFSVNLTKFGSQSGNAAFAPLGKSLLKGMNTALEGVGDQTDVSGRIMEGLFKGLGNALSGPLLVGGLAVLIKLLRDWRVQGMDAIKTLSGLNKSFHNLEIVTSSVGNFLREQPGHLLAISTASKTAEGSTRALAAATADYVKWATQKAQVDQLIGRTSGLVARGAVSQGVYSAPVQGRGETLQVRKASGGLIPEIAERMGAYAGGYTPGNVRQMNVPGMGRVYYNTAENVKQFPGMDQPAIMPPRNSRVGQTYQREFGERHGFDPYKAGGLIPNFAPNPALQKAFTERFYRAKRSLTEGEKFERISSSDPEFLRNNYKGRTVLDEFGTSSFVRSGFRGLSDLPETPTTVHGSIQAITSRAPDEVTRRQLLRLTREFDYGVSGKGFNKKDYVSRVLDRNFGNDPFEPFSFASTAKALKFGIRDRQTYEDIDLDKLKSSRTENLQEYLKMRKGRVSPYLFRGVSSDEITNLRRLGQVTSLGASNADDLLGTFVTSSFGKAAGFGAATLKESGQGYVLALDKKRMMSRPTADSVFGSEEKNTIKAGRIEKDDVLGVIDLKTRQMRSLGDFSAQNDATQGKTIRTFEEFKYADQTAMYGALSSNPKHNQESLQFVKSTARALGRKYNPYGTNYDTALDMKPFFERGGVIKLGKENEDINRLKSILSKPDSDILSTGRYSMARGLVPNFSPLSSAISRESKSVNPALIRVGSHSALRGPGNPDGVGVYNLRDEPYGLGQGVQRAMSMGLNPKNHGIPNFAPFKKQRDATKEYIFGNESSPGGEGMFGKALAASFIPAAISSMTGNSESFSGKVATGLTDALSLGLTVAAFARGKGGTKVAVGAGVLTGLMAIVKQSTNSFNTLDAEVNDLKNKIQKAGDGMGIYGQTLEQLQGAYLDNSTKAIQIVKLQEKLAQTLGELPEELRKQLMSAKTLEQVQDIGTRYSEARTSEFQQKELALNLSTNLNGRDFRRGSLIESSEKITEGMGKSKLEGVADTLLSALINSKGLQKIGGAAGLSSGDFLSKLKQGGVSGSVTEQLGRVRTSELDVIKSRLIGQAGNRENDISKIREMMPEKQRFAQQLAALEKQADAARKAIKQTFESIGQIANLRQKMSGREGIMRATGINEQIQGMGSLMNETSSPDGMAMTNYRSQLSSNQLKAASETSEVFAELRSGISDLFNEIDLSRMGDIPANVRSGQRNLLGVLGGQNSVGGIGEGAISIFKSLGKDEGVNDIKKLMSSSNEKLVEIQQTLREGNKIAEIQRNVAIQRAEFDRALKTGGGLSSFLDRGDKYGKISDIYGAQFGHQSGIFKGQGAIELVRSYLGAGGKPTDKGVSGLISTATEERALDIIETQKDLNRAFAGSGLKLGVPNISEARKLAGTQIAAELKTGDSDMERQMAGLERALQSAISSSFGGQMSDAAQTFANVLAGSDTFRLLNSSLEKNTQVLAGLEASLKGVKEGVNVSSIATSFKAGGNIPMAAAGYEKMMAKAGGYNSGNIRRAGNLIYNSAERVDYLPGIREPVISPPPGSLAGFLHRQNFKGMGFAAGGFDGFDLEDIDYGSGKSKLVDISDRKIVMVNKGGVKVPYYLSTGLAGKKNVASGKWYPFFGVDPQSGWINKGSESQISSHYGSKELESVAKELDLKIGDIRDPKADPYNLGSAEQKTKILKDRLLKLGINPGKGLAFVGHNLVDAQTIEGQKAISSINKGLNPISHSVSGTPQGIKAFSGAVEGIKSRLSSQVGGSTFSQYAGQSGSSMSSLKPLTSVYNPSVNRLQDVKTGRFLPPVIGHYQGTGKPSIVSPQAPSLATQAISTAAKASYSTKGFGDLAQYLDETNPSQYLDEIGPRQPANLTRGGKLHQGGRTFGIANPNLGKMSQDLLKAGPSRIAGMGLGVGFGAYEAIKGLATVGKGSEAARAGNVGGVAMETAGQALGYLGAAASVPTALAPTLAPVAGAIASGAGAGALILGGAAAAGGIAVTGYQAIKAQQQASKAYRAAGLSEEQVAKMKESGQLEKSHLLKGYDEGKAGSFGRMTSGLRKQTTVAKNFIQTGFNGTADYVSEALTGANNPEEYSFAGSRRDWARQMRERQESQSAQTTQAESTKAYQAVKSTRFQESQFGLMKGMSAQDRVNYFKSQGKYGQWDNGEKDPTTGLTMSQTGLRNASNEVNRDTLAKRYNITAPGQLDRLHKGVTVASAAGPKALQDYVAQLDKAFKGVAQAAEKKTEPQKENEKSAEPKGKLEITVTHAGNVQANGNPEEVKATQDAINLMTAQFMKQLDAIVALFPAEVRAKLAEARNGEKTRYE